MKLFTALSSSVLCVIFAGIAPAQNVGAAWVVPPTLEVDEVFISPESDDARFVVRKKRAHGIAEKNGKILIPIEYSNMNIPGAGWIMGYNGSQSYLFNNKGENIGLPYERFVAFGNGTAVVYKNKLCGLINQEGEEIVPVAFDQYKIEDGNIVFTGKDGEKLLAMAPTIVTPNRQRVQNAVAKSLLAGHYYLDGGKMKCGLLNLKKDTVVPPIYTFKSAHPSGYITASLDDKTWGVIDVRHKTLYPFTAERVGSWTDSGLLPIRSDKKWGLVRFPSGQVVFPFGEYENIEVYNPRKDIFMVVKNNLQGLVNVKKQIILPCNYTFIRDYTNATVELGGGKGKYGFWHQRSGFVQEPIYTEVKIQNDSVIVVAKDSMQALVDAKTGQTIIPFSTFQIDKTGNYFDSHKKFNFKIQATYKGHLHGLYDRKGKLIFPHDSVDIIMVPSDNSFWVMPQFIDAAQNMEQRTPEGKVLRSLPKIGGNIETLGFITSFIMSGNGIETAHQICYHDNTGKELYYKTIDKVQENLRRVKQQNDLWGFVDNKGKIIIQPVFEDATLSSNGYICVKYQGKWGVLQNPLFDYFKQFEEKIKK